MLGHKNIDSLVQGIIGYFFASIGKKNNHVARDPQHAINHAQFNLTCIATSQIWHISAYVITNTILL